MNNKVLGILMIAIGCFTLAFILHVLAGPPRKEVLINPGKPVPELHEPYQPMEYTYKGHLYVSFGGSGGGAWGGHAGHCPGVHK